MRFSWAREWLGACCSRTPASFYIYTLDGVYGVHAHDPLNTSFRGLQGVCTESVTLGVREQLAPRVSSSLTPATSYI